MDGYINNLRELSQCAEQTTAKVEWDFSDILLGRHRNSQVRGARETGMSNRRRQPHRLQLPQCVPPDEKDVPPAKARRNY